MYRDQGLERLDLVGEDGLPTKNEDMSAISRIKIPPKFTGSSSNVHFHASPESRRRLVVPGIDDATPHMFPYRRGDGQFDSGQRQRRHQSGQRKTMEYGQHIRLGAVSSVHSQWSANIHSPASVSFPVRHLPILVALRILMAKSASVLRNLLSEQIPEFPLRCCLPTHRGRWGALDACSGGKWNVEQVYRDDRLSSPDSAQTLGFALTPE